MQLIYAIIHLTYNAVMDHYAPLYLCTPYHTSSLSGADWVGELLAGHPNRIRNELGVYQGTFLVLTEIMKQAGLQSLQHVSIEEQLSISPLHRSHRVNFHSCRRMVSAVNKYDYEVSFNDIVNVSNRFLGISNGSYEHLQHPPSIQPMCSSPMPIHPHLPKSRSHASFIHSLVVLWVP